MAFHRPLESLNFKNRKEIAWVPTALGLGTMRIAAIGTHYGSGNDPRSCSPQLSHSSSLPLLSPVHQASNQQTGGPSLPNLGRESTPRPASGFPLALAGALHDIRATTSRLSPTQFQRPGDRGGEVQVDNLKYSSIASNRTTLTPSLPFPRRSSDQRWIPYHKRCTRSTPRRKHPTPPILDHHHLHPHLVGTPLIFAFS